MGNDDALTLAVTLLTRAPLFDGHNDLAWTIRVDKHARGDVLAYDLTRVHPESDTDIPRLREGKVGAQFWAAFQPTGAPHPARTALEQIDLIRRIEAAHPDVFHPARSAADFARAQREGKIASYIVVEGGVGLENALAPLRLWHAAGARMLIPCHNETLDWVDSATDAPRHGGFNAFGRAVIGECNRLGVIVDGAHVSHDGIRRLLDVSEAPILLSHSNAFSLCDHPRNAPDDVLRAAEGERRRGAGDLRARLRLAGLAQLAAEARSTPTARRRRSPTPRRASPRSKRATGRRRARRWPRSPTTSSIWSRRPA